MGHRGLRESETLYERAMKRDFKERDSDMGMNTKKRKMKEKK